MHVYRTFYSRLAYCFIACLLLLGFALPAQAQYHVSFDVGVTSVTASVPDIEPPSIPILISPEDESILTISKPTFEWYASTDNVGVDHYDLWLDGSLYLANIPTYDIETGFYTLDVNESTDILSLTVKQAIADGVHTWRITVADAADNQATSATWDFSIDTLVPSLSITEIEGNAVLITTADSETLPSEPIVTSTNAPLISGLGEANTTLLIILNIPGVGTTTTIYNIGAGGTWSFQFPELDDNVLATLTLLIEDEAGHTNVLSPIQFIFNPSATPAPSSTVVTATSGPPSNVTPTFRPIDHAGTVSPTPFPVPSSPAQPFIRLFNTPKTDFIIKRGQGNVSFVTTEPEPFWQWLAPLILIGPLLASLLLLASKFGRLPNLATLRLYWWIFGWNPDQPADGEVHDRGSLRSLWLIPVRTRNINTNKLEIITLTNQYGDFLLPQLEEATYTLEPIWSGLSFPSIAKRPESLPWHRFYLGEKATYDRELPWPFIHIPVEQLRLQPQWEKRLLEAMEWRGLVVTIQIVVLTIFYIAHPTLVTSIPVIICLLLGFVRYFSQRKRQSAKKIK